MRAAWHSLKAGLRARRGARISVELVLIVATALFFAFVIQAYAVKPYRIPSGSMEPTLRIGQRILVDRLTHRLGTAPKLGEITVFNPPVGADSSACGIAGQGPFYQGSASRRSCSRPTAARSGATFVKRVVGLPGDTIAIRGGHVVRNGVAAKEPFARSCSQPDCNLAPIVIPKGEYFMMGDNRGDSDDSRYWGPVPRSWIIGEVLATYWPPGRIGIP